MSETGVYRDSQPFDDERPFFVAGGTLPYDSPCYVERSADGELYACLRRGEFCYLLTARQMGKSSLIVRTAARLRREGVAVVILDLTALGHTLTIEQWYAGLLSLLGLELELEAELTAFWQAHLHLGPLQRWMAAVREVALPRLGGRVKGVGGRGGPGQDPTPDTPHPTPSLVIFIDEIDAVRSLPFPTDEFFAGIRECYNRRTRDPEYERLGFCLSGVATPSDLIQDTRTTPFNIGRRIELTDFTEAEAAPLAQGLNPTSPPAPPLQGEGGLSAAAVPESRERRLAPPSLAGKGGLSAAAAPQSWERRLAPLPLQGERRLSAAAVPESQERRMAPPSLAGKGAGGLGRAERLLRRILYWTGGHPYLTQRLCQAVAEACAGNPKSKTQNPKSEVDRLCAEFFLTPGAAERDDNLLFVRDRLLRQAGPSGPEVDLASLLELYEKVRAGRRVALDDTNQLVSVLRLSGIPRVRDGRLVVRNRIYDRVFDRAWVRAHMPDAERRRQRAAYRRGLARATAVWGAVLTLTGALAVTAAKQAHRAQRATVRANREADTERRLFYAADLNLAQEKYRGAELGAALRLLDETRPQPGQPDLRGFEWGYLWRLCHQNRRTLRGHTEGIWAVAFSPDGRMLASGGLDGSLKLWNPATARLIRSLRAGPGGLNSLVFSHDGRHLAVGGGAVELWDPRTGRLEHVFPVPKTDTTSVALSPDGKTLVSGHRDGTARLWDVASGRLVRALHLHTTVWSVAFSPGGKTLASGHQDGTARLWDVETGRPLRVLRGHSSFVYSLVFSPDGSRLATAGGDGTICLWNPVAGELLRALPGHSPYATYAVAFSPDSRILASAGWDTTVRLWDAATGKAEGTLLGHLSFAWCVAWSPDGRTLASGGYDALINLWNMAGEPAVRTLRGHRGDIVSAALSSDGRRLATGSLDGTAKVWDVDTGRTLCTLRERPGQVFVALSPDGRRVVTLPDGGSAHVWDAATGGLLYRMGAAAGVTHVAFTPDGERLLAVDGSGAVDVTDARTGRELLRLRGGSRRAAAFALSPDGRRIATADGTTVRVWDVEAGKALFTLPDGHGIRQIAFLPNSERMVTADNDAIVKVWDARTGQALFKAPWHARTVGAFSFSADGRLAATGSEEGTAVVWDTVTGREILTLNAAHTGAVYVAIFSPDGRRLVTAGGDNRAKIWDLATGRELLVLQGHTRDVAWAAFTPDGRRLITTSWDMTARVWESVIGSSAPPQAKG